MSRFMLAADAHAATALNNYSSMNYAGAAVEAQAAYQDVLAAAAQLKIKIEPKGWPTNYKSKGKSSKFVDVNDDQRMKP